MPTLTIRDLAEMTSGEVLQNPEVVVSSVVIDSREVKPDSVFFAIKGERLDGHQFLAQALQTARAIGGGPLLAAGVGGAALLDPVTTAARAGRSQGTHLHALNASRNTAGAATLPIAAAALAAGTWLVLRRRSLRHLAAAVAGAPADRTPSGFDPFDPVWPAPVATRVRRKGDDRRGLRDV